MQKLQQEQVLHHERLSGLVVLVLFIMVALISAGRVFVANRLVETSENLRRYDQEVLQLESQNQKLAEEIRTKESISTIEEKVKELGFVRTDRYAYLASAPEVALNITTGSTILR